MHVEPGARKHMRNAIAHRPRTEDAYTFDFSHPKPSAKARV
jgi:hypothetical protein